MSEEPKTHTLKTPIEYNGGKYDKLTVRPPKVADFIKTERAMRERGIKQADAPLEAEVISTSILCDVPEGVIQALGMHDYAAIGRLGKDFFLPESSSEEEG